MWKPNPSAGWKPMTREEDIKVWDVFYPAFSFQPSVFRQHWPVYAEPTPSITFHIGRVWKEHQRNPELYAQLVDDLNSKTLDAFCRCVSSNEKLYVLDWQHQCYWLYPHRAIASKRWGVSILPYGDYHIFLGKEFRFGILGQPWEKTICVFGRRLLNAFNGHLPLLFDRVVRKNGQDVDPSHSITWKIEQDPSPEQSYVFSKWFPDGMFVKVSIVKDDSQYRIKSLATPHPSIDTQGTDVYSSTDDLEWALHIVKDKCNFWDHILD
jgi:hypothetical protein